MVSEKWREKGGTKRKLNKKEQKNTHAKKNGDTETKSREWGMRILSQRQIHRYRVWKQETTHNIETEAVHLHLESPHTNAAKLYRKKRSIRAQKKSENGPPVLLNLRFIAILSSTLHLMKYTHQRDLHFLIVWISVSTFSLFAETLGFHKQNAGKKKQ